MIQVPATGGPTTETSSEDLIGVDGNAFAIMGATKRFLSRAGATKEFTDEYMRQAMSGDYDNLLAVSVTFLDA